MEQEEKVIDLTETLGHMTATLEDIKTGYTGLVAKVDGIEKKAYLVDPAKASLEDSNVLGGIMNFEVMNVPVGKALVGGGIAIFATEIIDGFFATQSVQMKGVIKLAGAAATMAFLKKPLGTAGAATVAVLLTFDALRDLTPLDTWMSDLATKITGIATTAGLADKSGRRLPGGAAVMQANQVASDYYARAEGRR